jgi:hypothetical protein
MVVLCTDAAGLGSTRSGFGPRLALGDCQQWQIRSAVQHDAATAWLAQLRIATAGALITPVTYGNPDLRLAKRLAPSELTFYQKYGANRVAFHLGRALAVDKTAYKSSTSKLIIFYIAV